MSNFIDRLNEEGKKLYEEGVQLYKDCSRRANDSLGDTFVLMDSTVTDLRSECRFMLGMFGDMALIRAEEWAANGDYWVTKSADKGQANIRRSYASVVSALRSYCEPTPQCGEDEHTLLMIYKEAVFKFLHNECDGLSRSATLEYAARFGLTEKAIELCGYTLPTEKEEKQ